MTAIINAILGVLLLLLGRKLYWFFVGVVGFGLGVYLATLWLRGESELVILVVGLIVGVIGALLAVFLQRLAVIAAGFLAGGFVLNSFVGWLGLGTVLPNWLFFLIGGIVGAVLVAVLFDWALIFLSSITGASLVVQSLHLGQWIGVVVALVLFVIGVVVQARGLHK